MLALLLAPVLIASLPSGETMNGAVAAGDSHVFTYGTQLRVWEMQRFTSRVLLNGPWGPGGCAVDLDGEHASEFVGVRGEGLGELVWVRNGTPEHMDTAVEMHDCIEATLFGRRGVLMIQRGVQVRFYERIGPKRWRSRDIYSIYTPSFQTGLALADVDGDGRLDVLCGNYWIRGPERFELPWRLFAINTWSETEDSAAVRIAVIDAAHIAVAQARVSPSRAAIFTRPQNPREQWPATPLSASVAVHRVRALLYVHGTVLVGEANGAASRLLAINPRTGGSRVLHVGDETLSLVPLAGGEVLVASPTGLHRIRTEQ